MKNAIIINQQQIVAKEYKGERVVTLRDVDTVHRRPDGTARKTFNRNKEHFFQGKDYFVLKTDEAQKAYGMAAPNGLILLKESGYLMLVKAFDDPLAWAVQRELVNVYFQRGKEKAGTTWRGVPVINIGALAQKIGVHSTTLRYWIQNSHFRENEDFFLLEGDALRAYKLENGLREYSASALYLVTQTGVKKIMTISKNPPEQLALPSPSPVSKIQYIQSPDNREFQAALESARRKLTAVEELLKLLNQYNTPEKKFPPAAADGV